MTIAIDDIKYYKSAVASDGATNGGRSSYTEITSGARNSFFSRVTQEQRTSGITRYRKEFTSNANASNETAYEPLDCIRFPSTSGDRFYIGEGTQVDTQADITATPPTWVGCGQLNTALSGGETSVDLLMSANDYVFIADGYLYLSNTYRTGQTVAASVVPGNGVTYSAGAWNSSAFTGDITYPKGLYLGNNTVMTHESGVSTTEHLQIAHTSPYSYSGNVVTVQLQEQVAGTYAISNTYGAQCLSAAHIKTSYDSFSLTSASGTYDEATYPPLLFNKGTVEDTITITMTSSTNFTCSGTYEGSMGTGSISADFSPTNASGGASFFTLRSAGWGGTLASGDILTFKTHPSKLPRWFKEVVPAATAAEDENVFVYSVYTG